MDRFRNTGQPDWDWWGRVWPTPGATLRGLGVAPGDRVAEVGSGNGYFALPAARIAAPGPVYALDVDVDCSTNSTPWRPHRGSRTPGPSPATRVPSRRRSPSPSTSRSS